MVERSSTVLLIIAFFTLILGVSLLISIAEAEQNVVSKTHISNESDSFATCRNTALDINNTGCNETLTNAPAAGSWQLTDDDSCPITNFVLQNCTGDTLTITTDYIVHLATGVYELKNVTDAICGIAAAPHPFGNTTFASYDYCADNYLNQSWQRSVMDVVVGLFAIALLVISVGLFYSIARREGIIGI